MDNFMSDDFARALINTDLGGYRIGHVIGNGGMAVVFAATSLIDPKIKRALKVIRPHYATQPRFVNRFSREALLLEQLHSPYIVGFHGVRRDRGHLYMELELLRGQDLRTLIESPAQVSEAERTPLEPLRVVRWLYQAALGLADAHQMKVVHRDLKPANLFLCSAEMFADQAERIKILDFGVAKVLDELESEQRHTLDGHVVGSPAFMAPEVCEGGSPTPQTDVYSLSLIGYQLLLGRHPLLKSNHRLNTMQVMLSHVQQSLPSLGELSGLPQGIEAVLLRGATRDPRARYRDGGELAHALGQVIETAERGVHPIFQPIHTRPGHLKSVEINAEHLFAEPTVALNDPLNDPNEPMNPIHSARARRNILISCLIFLTGLLGWYAVISGSFDAWVESLSETGSAQLSSTQRTDQVRSAQGDSAQGDSAQDDDDERGSAKALKRSPSSQGVSSAELTPQRSRSDESPRALLERLNLEWVPLAHHPRSLMKSEITVRQYELCQDSGACEQGSSSRTRGVAGLYGECITRATKLSSRGERAMNCLSYQDVMSFARWVESLYRAQLQSAGEPSGESSSEPSNEPSGNSNDSRARSEINVGPPTLDDWRVAWGAARYPWGDASPSCERAIFFEGSPACGGALSPAPACSAQHRREGDACDLAGNLWEWLAWDQAQRDAPLITGGGWSSDSADLNRDSARPEPHDTHAPHIGARLVITLPIASLKALARREPSAHTPKSGAP